MQKQRTQKFLFSKRQRDTHTKCPFEMSEYERARLERIKQNEQVLRDLGLNEKVEMMKKSSTKKRSARPTRGPEWKEKAVKKFLLLQEERVDVCRDYHRMECTFKLYYREVNRYYHMEIPR